MINEVYIVVQELLNKNGYGLLTPTRFVAFAESAQLRVLEEALDEYRIKKRDAARYDAPDTLNSLEAIIEIFAARTMLSRETPSGVMKYHTLPSDYMRWGSANIDGVELVKQPSKTKAALERSYFISPTDSAPFCYIEGNKLYALPDTIGAIKDGNNYIAYDEIELVYYRYPKKPNWTYVMIDGKTPVFNPDSELYQDFEVPQSLFNRLVTNILGMVSVKLRDDFVAQVAANQDETDFTKRNR